MRILLVEDQQQYAGLVADKLVETMKYSVTLASDPLEAEQRLRAEQYDVTVVDVLYDRFSRDLDSQRLAELLKPGAGELVISGLYILHFIEQHELATRPVLWTSGDTNRHLHMVFAYEEFKVRCYSSKGSRRLDPLTKAISAASQGGSYIDPMLNPFLPSPGSPSLKQTILSDTQRRAIWRAIAMGYHSRAEIQTATHYSQGHIGNLVSRIYAEDLVLLDPGLPQKTSSPLTELVRYASRHWEFLLDETVRKRYP